MIALAFLFIPDRTLPTAEASKVLERYYTLLHEAKSIHYVEEANEGGGYRAEEWLMRPDRWRSEISSSVGGVVMRQYSTSKEIITVDVRAKTYRMLPRLPGTPFQNGLEPYTAAKRPAYTKTGKVTEKTYKGKSIYAIQTGEQSIPGSMVSVFVDRKSMYPVAWEYAVGTRGEMHDYTLFKINEAMKASDFAWVPPKEFKKTGRDF